jgi:hypothetical protein
VKVEGPESAIRLAKEILTDIVRVDGRSSSMEVMVNLFPDRPGVHITSPAPAALTAEIREHDVTRVVGHVAVRALGSKYKVQFTPPAIDVTLEGPPEIVSVLSESDLSVVVDMGSVAPRPGLYRLRPRVVFNDEDAASKVTVRALSVLEVGARVLREGSPW